MGSLRKFLEVAIRGDFQLHIVRELPRRVKQSAEPQVLPAVIHQDRHTSIERTQRGATDARSICHQEPPLCVMISTCVRNARSVVGYNGFGSHVDVKRSR